MSYITRSFVAPAHALPSEEALADEVCAALRTMAVEMAETVFVLVADGDDDRAAWSFTFGSEQEGGELDLRTLVYCLQQRPRLATLTELYHNDRSGLFEFNHAAPEGRFSLGSVGQYLCGDVDAVTVDYPQKGYSNEELLALYRRSEDDLSEREVRTISEYQHAITIGLAMLYGGGVRYLDALHAKEAWQVWSPAGDVEGPIQIRTPDRWSVCLSRESSDDLAELDGWLADA